MCAEKTDEEIVFSYKNGNIEIFKLLVERYTSPIFNFTARFAGKNNAPDVTQEVFIKVWKKINDFSPEKSSFKTWIFTIAKNTSIDFLRKSGKITTFTDLENKEEDSFSETITDQSVLPDEVIQKLQDKDFLNNLLDHLSIEYKTVLVLHYQEELTFDEIGKVLNKPLNTVKSYHHRAILKLRKMI